MYKQISYSVVSSDMIDIIHIIYSTRLYTADRPNYTEMYICNIKHSYFNFDLDGRIRKSKTIIIKILYNVYIAHQEYMTLALVTNGSYDQVIL